MTLPAITTGASQEDLWFVYWRTDVPVAEIAKTLGCHENEVCERLAPGQIIS
jgi:hypothetical protein